MFIFRESVIWKCSNWQNRGYNWKNFAHVFGFSIRSAWALFFLLQVLHNILSLSILPVRTAHCSLQFSIIIIVWTPLIFAYHICHLWNNNRRMFIAWNVSWNFSLSQLLTYNWQLPLRRDRCKPGDINYNFSATFKSDNLSLLLSHLIQIHLSLSLHMLNRPRLHIRLLQ